MPATAAGTEDRGALPHPPVVVETPWCDGTFARGRREGLRAWTGSCSSVTTTAVRAPSLSIAWCLAGRRATASLGAYVPRVASLLPPVACVVGVLLWEGRAHAEEPRFQLETSLDARDVWVRTMPAMSLRSPFDTPLRTLPAGTLPSTGSQQFLSFTWDSQLAVNDRWLVPLFGIQFGWAIGTSPEVVTSLDGSIVHMRTWSADLGSALLPGVGLRVKRRRWMFAADVRGVLSFAWMNANAATGADSADLAGGQAFYALAPGVRAELEACRRLDPVQRACVIVSPALYEFSAFNGGSIGIRWEVGP